jgi:hypothetical protein
MQTYSIALRFLTVEARRGMNTRFKRKNSSGIYFGPEKVYLYGK